jgi:hypothetical protein
VGHGDGRESDGRESGELDGGVLDDGELRTTLLGHVERIVGELVPMDERAPDRKVGSLADGDIMALALLVMMEAARSAQEDLKAIMDRVRSINRQKAAWRDVANEINEHAAGVAECRIKDQLDSLAEMGQMESLRLQMAMDRLSKLMSTVSNLLKRTSETAASITQNLK